MFAGKPSITAVVPNSGPTTGGETFNSVYVRLSLCSDTLQPTEYDSAVEVDFCVLEDLGKPPSIEGLDICLRL